ncbi:fructose-6-phosphate aldolase [Veillonella sp. YH-vei2232]|jgi:transaldolase|uniref:Probable transaldolase n=1 Tax=Veillonella absiana TaxID=3079305 RepID=A0ABU3Z9S9_9FIRM|nr:MULTISPECIES: fructose-6-phosphate aldolase [unclassified Veillonella]MBP8615913.1 fructose-6-phosphate aldolase [Veillonella sp.]MBP9516431.1 fructose-6-phosphate aldolase [Veillonella sp.]MBP9550627.1 fructose-6-phosphate aldolase [Veillonella sp.]MDV5063197.1 fructose-6-phosphate aldolase [Veillonella sp. YH-vei2232]MDV5088673.1 fructose-6-phosphate aldolase [Veillonella sp. YH-vei2233]
MKFFIDTAEFEEIKAAYKLGFVDGVTTNPSLIVKSKRNLQEVIKEIAALVEGPVSAEVIATEAPDMVKEAHELVKLGDNVVIKVPMTPEGLKAVAILSKEGIKTNVTLIFSANQALLAARAGATYVSPFVGRIDDISMDGITLIEDVAEIFMVHNIETEIIAASVRTPIHITQCAKAGAHIATVPYKVLLQAMKHPLTDAGLARFLEDWKQANQ